MITESMGTWCKCPYSRLQLEQMATKGDGDRLGTVGRAKLGKDHVEVIFRLSTVAFQGHFVL